MRLLVTGGAGFIGSNFTRWWLSQHTGDEVVVLDALTYAGNPANLDGVEGTCELV
ncbi:MAG: dTDP-glucose 4,6-dehydratase, partial [Actinomycetota bacterium]|nr:dTDP-glucose 4,6-dehydratase [Actinomycetota bacterium]